MYEIELIDILTTKLIVTMKIEKSILEHLATTRAKAIKDYLIAQKLDKDRIILINEILQQTNKDIQRVSIDLEIDIKEKEEI